MPMPKDLMPADDPVLDVMTAPIEVRSAPDEAIATIKVDSVSVRGRAVLITGWSSDPDLDIGISFSASHTVHKYPREDVAASLGMAANATYGFMLLVVSVALDTIEMRAGDTTLPIAVPVDADEPTITPEMAAGLFRCLEQGRVGAPLWQAAASFLPETPVPIGIVAGAVDTALSTRVGVVVAGWCVQNRLTHVWLEDPEGRARSLKQAYWHDRPDVLENGPALNMPSARVGFIADLKAAGPRVRLCGASRKGRFVLSDTDTKMIGGSVKDVAAYLHTIPSARIDISKRAHLVDLPHLTRLQRQLDAVETAPRIETMTFGVPVNDPKISVIVPLYGRIDFVEHQLLAFVTDPDFQDAAELIYVLDDPRKETALRSHAPMWQRICGCPFRVVYTGRNSGFSTACNIGAKTTKADTLIFLNSDVFPRAPGWASALKQDLDDNDGIGIVAPQLLFPDGGLQHAGMVPYWRPALNIWSNRHQYMGFDPALDPAKTLTDVPLVTGACVAVRRRDFDAVGGWNRDYLLGDFEDSELCLAINKLGLSVAYDPIISLTHIERQSVPGIGEASFREYVTLLNAARFTRRWGRKLTEMMA